MMNVEYNFWRMMGKVDPENYFNNIVNERNEARRVARQWYREAQRLRHSIILEHDAKMTYYRMWRGEASRAEAAEKRIKELERALTDAEQTLRNLSNGELTGDAAQIAHNAALNLLSILNKR